ncbi:MAG: ATP-binding protein [Bacteroidetes bacterium]|nr:ATP-binding protein [Bacteroidota bacterium]
MNKKKLLDIIRNGENLRVEFKQRFSSFEKIAKEMIALANTKGGYIILGIDDDHSLYGLDNEKGDVELLNKTAQEYCVPPIDLKIQHFEIDERDIILAEIPESKIKPHRIQDYKEDLDIRTAQVFIRVSENSVHASKEMIKLLQASESGSKLKNYEIGKNEKIVFSYLEDNDTINVKTLNEIANISGRRASRTLIKMVRANLLMIHTKDNGETYFSISV